MCEQKYLLTIDYGFWGLQKIEMIRDIFSYLEFIIYHFGQVFQKNFAKLKFKLNSFEWMHVFLLKRVRFKPFNCLF